MVVIITLWHSCAYLHMRHYRRLWDYSKYACIVKIYREYSTNGILKSIDNGNIFIYTNLVSVNGTNFIPVIGMRTFVDDDQEFLLVDKHEKVIFINKDSKIKVLDFDID